MSSHNVISPSTYDYYHYHGTIYPQILLDGKCKYKKNNNNHILAPKWKYAIS